MEDINNFGRFFEKLRLSRNATLNDLAEGLCSKCLITKIESGERFAKRNIRVILLGRLGTSFEEMTEYVSINEYNYICKKNYILEIIDNNDYRKASLELESLLNTYSGDRIAKQFYYACMSMIAENTASEKRRHLLVKAIEQTMTFNSAGEVVNAWLAPCELNLLLEYALCLDNEDKCIRIVELLNYIEQHEMIPRCKALIYPRLVYYYCQTINDAAYFVLENAIEKIGIALDLLNKTKKLYYQVELLETEICILLKLIEIEPNDSKRLKCLDAYKSASNMLMVFRQLGNYTAQSIYMSNWTYIYKEHDVRTAGRDIYDRRKMFRLSREQVYEMICSEKTFSRLENLKGDIHGDALIYIFEKLGINPINKQNYIEVYDLETKVMEERLRQLVFSKRYDEAKSLISIIRQKTKELSPWTEQILLMTDTMINQKMRMIDNTVTVNKLRQAFFMTIPYKVMNAHSPCLSRNEQLCFYNIILRSSTITQEEEILLDALFDRLKECLPDTELGMLELYYIAMIKLKLAGGATSEAMDLCDEAVVKEIQWHRSSIICNVLEYKLKILRKCNSEQSLTSLSAETTLLLDKLKEIFIESKDGYFSCPV